MTHVLQFPSIFHNLSLHFSHDACMFVYLYKPIYRFSPSFPQSGESPYREPVIQLMTD